MFEGLGYHLGPLSGTKVRNVTTGRAKLFHCDPALPTGEKRPDSAGKHIHSTSNVVGLANEHKTHAYVHNTKSP